VKGDLIRIPTFPETIKMSYEFFYRLRDGLAFLSRNVLVFKSSDLFINVFMDVC